VSEGREGRTEKKTKNLIKITEIKNLLVNKDFRYRTNRSISMNS